MSPRLKLVVPVFVVALCAATTAHADSVKLVTGCGQQNWNCVNTGAANPPQLVTGPGVPPVGNGSVQLSVGANGANGTYVENPDYAGFLLSDLTVLSYATYVQTYVNGQAPYLVLALDFDGDAIVEDALAFEPVYQTGGYPSSSAIPNQCGVSPNCVDLNTWQSWDALVGGWWSFTAATSGPPLVTIADYVAAHPTARIVNDASFGDGVSINAGFGAGAWDNFLGNADALRIQFNGMNQADLHNFDAAAAAEVPEPATLILLGSGLLAVGARRRRRPAK